MIPFFENPPAAVIRAKSSRRGPPKPWTLLFNPEACDEEHAGKTLEEMELPEEEVVAQAKEITELREQLRWAAAAAANQPDQLQYYEEKELKELEARVSRDHYPLQGQQKRERQRALRDR